MRIITATRQSAGVRSYSIDDEAEGFQLQFCMDGEQIGGAYFPDSDGAGSVFEVAYQLGEAFIGAG